VFSTSHDRGDHDHYGDVYVYDGMPEVKISDAYKTDRQEITKILVKVVFNTIKQKQTKHCLIHHNSTMVDTNLARTHNTCGDRH
jgi:hypothetical protein